MYPRIIVCNFLDNELCRKNLDAQSLWNSPFLIQGSEI